MQKENIPYIAGTLPSTIKLKSTIYNRLWVFKSEIMKFLQPPCARISRSGVYKSTTFIENTKIILERFFIRILNKKLKK